MKIVPAFFYHLSNGDLANQSISPKENWLWVNKKEPLMGNIFIWNFQNVWPLEIF